MTSKATQYEEERKDRWSMAKEGEPIAMEAIQNRLLTYYGLINQAKRYDEIYFKKYSPENEENAWIRGASDYVIEIDGEEVLIEIKLKNQKFRKTKGGGKTQDGSMIRDYGCESYYLDIEPVFKNMCDFCSHENISPESFIIFFCGDDNRELRYISLARVIDLVNNGYKGEPLTEFGEGYGINTESGRAITYLIPEDTTIDISDKRNVFKREKEDCFSRILHHYIKRIYGYQLSSYGYYHMDRNCKFIRNKQDKSLSVFYSENEAENNGYIRCKQCGGD